MITVVVPTMWRYSPFLDLLKYILKVDVVTECIIINNDNTRTPTHPVLTNPKVKLVDFGKNIFVNPAWNYGVQHSSNNIVCILNDDLIFDLKLFYFSEKIKYLFCWRKIIFFLPNHHKLVCVIIIFVKIISKDIFIFAQFLF